MASRRRRKTPRHSRPVPRLSRGRSAEQILFDDAVEQAIELRRMAVTEGKRLAKIWTDLEDPLSDALTGRLERLKARGYTKPWQTKAYREALERTRDLTEEAHRLFFAELTAVVRASADLAVAMTQRSIVGVMSGLDPKLAFRLPPTGIIRGAALAPTEGLTLAKWSQNLKTSARQSVEKVVNRGLIQGRTLPATTKQIREALRLPQHQAESLTRTAVKHSTTAAKEATYQANSHVIIGVVWIATLDSRTTDICGGLDGRTFPLGEGIRPPAHFNCRSEIGPLTRDPADIVRGDLDKPVTQQALDESAARRAGRRPAADYEKSTRTTVPVRVSYPKWLRSQPAAVQDRALGGPARGKLFRSGKVQVHQFSDADGRRLRLDELQAKYGG